MRERVIKIAQLTVAILLSPIIFIFYLLDRAILLPLVWLPVTPFNIWARDNEKIGASLLRVVTIATIYAIYSAISVLIS